MTPIAITGIGLVTSIGGDSMATWQHLLGGQSGIRAIDRFDATGIPVRIAACIDASLDCVDATWHAFSIGRRAADEALQMARLDADSCRRIQVFAAEPAADIGWSIRLRAARCGGGNCATPPAELPAALSDVLSRELQMKVPPVRVHTACASGATAIQLACASIRTGVNDAAVVLGSDCSVSPETIVRFSLLSALSRRNDEPARASRPFARDRDGFVIGEGAGAMVLEAPAAARARGARILALVIGCGDATDTFHRTRNHPSGASVIAAMQRALVDGGLSPHAIDHVNTHGTGTRDNDAIEARAIQAVFGRHAERLPVTANKSLIGHTLSACGVVEAAISVLTLMHQMIPPTANYDCGDDEARLDVVAAEPRRARVRTVLSNSFGFGGQNGSIAFGCA